MAQEVLGVCRCFPRHHTSNAPRLFGPVRLLLLSPLRPAMPCRRLVGPLSFEKYRGTHSGNALYRHPEKGFALGRAVHTSSYNLLGTRKRCLTTQICLQAAVPQAALEILRRGRTENMQVLHCLLDICHARQGAEHHGISRMRVCMASVIPGSVCGKAPSFCRLP